MAALPKIEPTPMFTGVAEVTVIDGRQAVLLPENLHVDATRLDVVQHGASLSMSPARKRMTKEEIEQWFAEMDKFQQELGDFMPEGRNQPAMPDGNDIKL